MLLTCLRNLPGERSLVRRSLSNFCQPPCLSIPISSRHSWVSLAVGHQPFSSLSSCSQEQGFHAEWRGGTANILLAVFFWSSAMSHADRTSTVKMHTKLLHPSDFTMNQLWCCHPGDTAGCWAAAVQAAQNCKLILSWQKSWWIKLWTMIVCTTQQMHCQICNVTILKSQNECQMVGISWEKGNQLNVKKSNSQRTAPAPSHWK